jgi:hypothetical protein
MVPTRIRRNPQGQGLRPVQSRSALAVKHLMTPPPYVPIAELLAFWVLAAQKPPIRIHAKCGMSAREHPGMRRTSLYPVGRLSTDPPAPLFPLVPGA